MASNIQIQSPYEFFTDRTGRALANGRIYIGLPGQDPENFPQTVYFDVGGATPATQPVRTNVGGYPCDTTGNPQRIFVGGAYSIRVKDSNGVQVFYAQNSTDGFDGVYAVDLANQTDPEKGSGMVGFALNPGASGMTVHERMSRGWVDIKDFGAVGDGVTNDKAAFDAAVATGRAILLPAGNYNVPSGNYGNGRFYSFDGATCTNPTVAIVDPLANSLAVGSMISFPCIPDNLPFGWLHRNGQTLNRSVYPQLWEFANSSGNIVDEVDKSNNKSAFGRGNGTTTFSIPDDRATNAGFADAGAGIDATFILGKQTAVTAASAAPGITVRSSISTPAIRAFAAPVNQGSIDIQALQAQVASLQTRSLTSAAAITTTGATSFTFTGIPPGTKKITVMLRSNRVNGNSAIQVQLGSGAIDAAGYASGAFGQVSGTNFAASSTTGFITMGVGDSTATITGVLTLTNIEGTSWVCGGSTITGPGGFHVAGSKTLSGPVDRLRLTSLAGVANFNLGTVNILYEG